MIWIETYTSYLKRGLSVAEAVQAADDAKAAYDARFPERSIDEILRELSDPKLQTHGYEGKQAKLRSEIDQAANKKRSAAASGNDNAAKGRKKKTVVVHNEQQLNEDRAKGRKARAAEASVSSATQARKR